MEDRLDGAGNFVPWKARLVLILEENELWDEVVHNTTRYFEEISDGGLQADVYTYGQQLEEASCL